MARASVLALTLGLGWFASGCVRHQPPALLAFSYWCPMHPDERSFAPGPCPICRMQMVPIPPMRVGEMAMDIRLIPAEDGRALDGLQFVIRDPADGRALRRFETTHERLMHLFLVSRDLTTFRHVHPELSEDGSFDYRGAIPAGEYVVVADFVPVGGAPQTLQRAVMTPGLEAVTGAGEVVELRPTASSRASDLVVRMGPASVIAGVGTDVTFSVTEGLTGTPVTDLEPYLGAPAHLLLVSTDLTDAVHGHPEAASSPGGPDITFYLTLPRPGLYKLWLQVQRRAEVVTFPMVLEAKSRG